VTRDPQPQPRPADAAPTYAPLAGTATYAELDRLHLTTEAEAAGLGGEAGGEGGEAGPWLFDVCADPSERDNLYNSTAVAGVQAQLEARLKVYRRLMVPALYNTVADDYRLDPGLPANNNTWTWFGCEAD
jgi:hypothetical protein